MLKKSNIEIAIILPQIARFDKIWHTAELLIIKPILQSLCYAVSLTFDLLILNVCGRADAKFVLNPSICR